MSTGSIVLYVLIGVGAVYTSVDGVKPLVHGAKAAACKVEHGIVHVLKHRCKTPPKGDATDLK